MFNNKIYTLYIATCTSVIYFIYYQFDDDRVTQKDKPAAVLPNVYNKNFLYHISRLLVFMIWIYIMIWRHIRTIVWEKFTVGNIHEMRKKFVVNYFRLSRLLQTITNCSIYLWLKKFRVLNFCHTWLLTKIFSCQIFSKLRYITYMQITYKIIKKKQVSM